MAEQFLLLPCGVGWLVVCGTPPPSHSKLKCFFTNISGQTMIARAQTARWVGLFRKMLRLTGLAQNTYLFRRLGFETSYAAVSKRTRRMCRSYEQLHKIRYLGRRRKTFWPTVEEEKPFDLEACFGKDYLPLSTLPKINKFWLFFCWVIHFIFGLRGEPRRSPVFISFALLVVLPVLNILLPPKV